MKPTLISSSACHFCSPAKKIVEECNKNGADITIIEDDAKALESVGFAVPTLVVDGQQIMGETAIRDYCSKKFNGGK